MKKKILLISAIAIILSLIASGTLAYFTAEETAHNIITTGNIKIQLQEWSIPPGGEPEPFKDEINVLPGTEVSKIVEVKNIGLNSAWIRISLEDLVTLKTGETTGRDETLISYDINTEKWIENDGYFYYSNPVEPGETTVPLFTKVIFSVFMGNDYQESIFEVNVLAQATQVANNGSTVFEAAGWPEKLAE